MSDLTPEICQCCGMTRRCTHFFTENGDLFICAQCISDLNQRNPALIELRLENERLRTVNTQLAERCAAQSELLSRRAEKSPSPTAPS